MDVRKIDVVTTCKYSDLPVYGYRMIESFIRHWPCAVDLHFVGEVDRRFTSVFDYPWPEWHTSWKARHANVLDAHGRDRRRNRLRCPDYDFRRDCVRFSHKIAALTEVAGRLKTDILIWMDADIITHSRVNYEHIYSWLPESSYISWFDRVRLYPECGFVMFNAAHAQHLRIMGELRRVYESDEVFELDETHDSFVIENIIHRMVAGGYIGDPNNLSTRLGMETGDPFNMSPLSGFMTHLKGKRKYEAR